MKQIIQRPYITEKSLTDAAQGWYTFVVDPDADKGAISREVARLYRVTVTSARTLRVEGKKRRVGRKMRTIAKPQWKKAIVRLGKGQTISAFEVSQTQEEPKKK
ncbi:50S ribosomal protein L23 [Patescibacteria group bacterium]|nr:50S ribosomal protein L23 [Patescibacteria group bacterium]